MNSWNDRDRRQNTRAWRRCLRLLRCVVILLLPLIANAAEPPVSKSRFSGVAIGGMDTTAYATLSRDPHGEAVEGVKRFDVEYLGATWRFATAASRDAFAADPARYLPAYNGFCANALSLGEGLVRTDGSHWEIFGDTLYLFYADAGRQRWLDGDWQAFREEADAAWSAVAE